MPMREKAAFNRFLVVWSGQLISNIGSGLSAFALGVFVYQSTHTATSYAMTILFAFLPAFLLTPFGGVLVDRFDRRLLMIIGDLGSALGIVLILAMILLGKIELWHIYLGVAISSLFVALQSPAYSASISDFLPKDSYAKASGLMQLAGSAQFIISPVLAGFLISVMEMKYVLIIDIITFMIAVAAVFWIRKGMEIAETKSEKQHFFIDLVEGLNYLVVHQGILWLLGIISLINFSIGFLLALVGPMMLNFTDARTLGITQSVCAIGMLISSLLIGIFGSKKNHVTITSVGLMLTGLFYALLGLSTNIIFIVVAGFLFFCTLPFVNTSLQVLIRNYVENEKQGRIWSWVSVISSLGMLAAYSIAGLLADHVFNPLLLPGGQLASTVGQIIGTGQGRGIGLMFLIAGILVSLFAFTIGRIKVIRSLEVR